MADIVTEEDRTIAQIRQEEVLLDLWPVYNRLIAAGEELSKAQEELHEKVRYSEETEEERLMSLEMEAAIAQANKSTRKAFSKMVGIQRALERKMGYTPVAGYRTGKITRMIFTDREVK